MALQHAAGRQAGDRAHQLDRVADRMRDRVEIGVPDIAPPGIVLERGVAGRVEADRHVELFERVPQRLDRVVVQMLAVDRVRRADDRDRAQFRDAAPRLVDRRLDIVHRQLRGEFEPRRVGLAVIGGPVVVGARQRRGVIGRQIVVAQDLPAARAVHDRDVDPFDVHRGQRRGRVVAAARGRR